MLKFIKDILLPEECLFCGQTDYIVCPNCLNKIPFNFKTYKLPAPNLDKILIAGDYNNRQLAQLIKNYKYRFQKNLGVPLGEFLINYLKQKLKKSAIQELIAKQKVIVVPLPLSNKRRRWRGFNQAEILARAIADEFNWPMSLDLKRIKNRRPQAKLKEADRLVNLQGAFTWRGDCLDNATIILIDDIITTGATLNEAADVLKDVDAGTVIGLAVAKG